MGIFINWHTTLECAALAIIFATFLSFIAFKALGILQGFGYRGSKLFGWAKRKNNLAQARYFVLALACVLAYAVIALCFGFAGARWSAVIGIIGYIIFFVLYLVADSRRALRVGATLTPRFKRLFATVWLTFAILIYLVATSLNFAAYVWGARLFASLKYCALAFVPAAVLPIVALANLITLIWETPKNRSYVRRAQSKLAAADVTVIGITGSYGKTSAKNVLAAMLKERYRVLASPASYNTPLGIARTVNNADLSEYDIFVAEMGARHVGDVAELCAICKPKYSLITGVCPQHLESFGSLENIVRAKGEIITGTDGECHIAADCFDMFDATEGVKVKCDCVSDVAATCEGTKFSLTLGGETAEVSTKLLGEHTAYNIGLCAALAFKLGVPLAEIVAAAEELDFTEHRLQHTESNGVHILDDGYNSNVVGARAALSVLRLFGGKKIAVTPGLVELGILEESENVALGGELVGLDYVILVGETLVGAVRRGYAEGGGDEEKIVVVPTLEDAQDKLKGIISKGDAVLFLNDLPDIYN